jgi:hypothetical protein
MTINPMITATIEINELPNGVITCDFQPGPASPATKAEIKMASLIDSAIQAAMHIALMGSPRGEMVEAADNSANIDPLADALKERARNLPPRE